MPANPKQSPRRRRLLRAARLAVVPAALAVLAPASADAKIIELGETSQPATPSCPAKPCLAVSRTTGYQAKVGPTRGLFTAPEKGRIVAWSVTLGAPTDKQVKFFNTTLGGAPSAGIAVFKPKPNLFGVVKGKSPVEDLTHYLGETVQFPLERSLRIKKGHTVALNVPTWAPALAIGFGPDTSWRASRGRDQCDDTSTDTTVGAPGESTRFMCLYKTARLTYSVTMITDPHGPPKKKKSKKKKRSSAKRSAR